MYLQFFNLRAMRCMGNLSGNLLLSGTVIYRMMKISQKFSNHFSFTLHTNYSQQNTTSIHVLRHAFFSFLYI